MPTRSDDDDNAGFAAERKLIRFRLDRLDSSMDEVKDAVSRIEIEIATLKLRAGAWGAIAGALPSLIAAAAYFLWKGRP